MASIARLTPALILALVSAAIAAPATAASCTPARQLAAADAYLAALSDRTKAGAVPFAPNAVRFENGLQTGFSGEQLRRDLDRHLQYSVMDAPRVTARTVAPGGDRDLLNYRFIVPVRIAGQRIVDAPTDEDFRIPRSTCLITRIDARITVAPPR
ncbi:hypothetical protein FK529_19055 [Tsukamurella asaccharolytica]|uniref:DUF8021 domain-containing protein n=1 Tax=Tsukamurella asaccharolytica TaxID=2592067 RepID=A0A5C5R4Q3_9ACTN|nr:hypothetical protein [Tsukamurella asaccharolytica]TWS17712.1 hypothetical protein FK529_19055 [Tsukamurella asaccharolytica]